MKQYRGVAILLSAVVLVISCKKKEDTQNTDTCPKVWTVTNNAGTNGSVSISNGDLILSSENTAPGLALMVHQDGISGDFEATFSFNAFVPGDSLGGFVQMAVTDVSGPANNRVTAGIGNVPAVGISAVIDSSGSSSSNIVIKNSVSKSGTFMVKRSGSLVTVRSIAGTDTAKTSGTFSSNTLRLGLQLGSNYKKLHGKTTVHITDFTLSGGGNMVKSDNFNCNSLK